MANDDSFRFDPSLLIQTPRPSSDEGIKMTTQDLRQYFGSDLPTMPTTEQAPSYDNLFQARLGFAKELEDPQTRRLLMASTAAEVGGQGPAAEQAYMESVMNRALARNRSLTGTIIDPTYYPSTTMNKLGTTFSQSEIARYAPIIKNVLGGSNVSNLATGNESGTVRSGGAPITYNPGTGERFVAENADRDWYRNTLANLTQQGLQRQQAQPQPLTIAQYLTQIRR